MTSQLIGSPIKPERVIVLGGSGFLGRYICQKLNDEHINYICLSSEILDLAGSHAEDYLLSILKPTDSLIILAALTPKKGIPVSEDIHRFLKNVKMIQSVCSAISKIKVDYVIYVSTDAVYSRTCKITEKTQLQADTLYGMAHLCRELMLSFSIATDSLLIVRPCAIFGPGDPHNAYGPNRFLKDIFHKTEMTLFGNGEERRDHVYVEDVARIVSEVLKHKITGSLNIASGNSISFSDLAKLLSKIVSFQFKILKAERMLEILHKEFDNTLFRNTFPDFKFTDLSEGLKKTCLYMESLTKEGN
jgi:UDP-glucose 4-epimerase